MKLETAELRDNRKFVILMLALTVTLLIDTAFVKINDLVDKYMVPLQSKLVLFAVNSSVCLFLQLFIIKFTMNSFGRGRLSKTPKVKSIYIISLTSFLV